MKLALAILAVLLTPALVQCRRLLGRREIAGSTGATGMCSEDMILNRACTILAQSPMYIDEGIFSLSEEHLIDYFAARPKDITSFLNAIHADKSITCANLCTGSLRYIRDVMRLKIPARHGQLCSREDLDGNCEEWEPMDEFTITEIANELSPTAMSNENYSGTVEHYDVIHEENYDHSKPGCPVFCVANLKDTLCEPSFPLFQSCNSCGFCDCQGEDCGAAFDYSIGELALRIAKLFEVHPYGLDDVEEDSDGSVSSLIEGAPAFGERVSAGHRRQYKVILASSHRWVEAARSKLTGSMQAIKSWFGQADRTTMEAVRRILIGMEKTLDMSKIKVGQPPVCAEGTSTLAYVTAYTFKATGEFAGGEMDGNRYVINMCDRYWKFANDPSVTYGTLVHESSHHHGTGDVPYRGSTPYGRAPCLRMAKHAPEKALNNADSFMWLVYYLNRCADAPSSISQTPPCQLRLSSGRGEIGMDCKMPVQGMTLTVEDDSGHWLDQRNFGNVQPGSFVTDGSKVAAGSVVKLHLEHQCVMWEAEAVRSSRSTVVVDVTQVLVMSAGGNAESLGSSSTPSGKPSRLTPPSAPTTTTKEFPCELYIDTSIELVDGEAGFTVIVKCSRAVLEARLEFHAPPGLPSFRDKFYGIVEPGTWKLFTHAIDEFQGYNFVFSASMGGNTYSINRILPRRITPTRPAYTPAPPVVTPAPPAPTTGSNKCDVFCFESLKHKVCDPTYPLFTSCEGCDFCRGYSGSTTSITGFVYTPAPPVLTPAPLMYTPSCDSFCRKERKDVHCSPTRWQYDNCGGCDFCKSGDSGETSGAEQQPQTPVHATATRCLDSCKSNHCHYIFDDQNKPDSFWHPRCGGCSFCQTRSGVPFHQGALSSNRCDYSVCRADRKFLHCKVSPYSLKCSSCSFCHAMKRSTQRKSKKEVKQSSTTQPKAENRNTCGKFINCNREEPIKYCNGWRKRYCGGCSWC